MTHRKPTSKAQHAASPPTMFSTPAPTLPADIMVGANAALFAIQMTQASFRAWRDIFDASRLIMRQQQDAILDALDTQIHEAIPEQDNAPVDSLKERHEAFG